MMVYPRVTLGDLAEIVTKGTTPKTLGKQYATEGIPFLRGEDVRGRAVDPTSTQYFIDEETHRLLRRSQILPGDLLITIAGSVGRVGYVADDAPAMNCNQAVAIVRIDRKNLDLEYACYACQAPAVLVPLIQQGTTATITNLSLQQVRSLRIPFPPLDEQRRIVDILNHAASIRRLREQAQAKAREIIPALFLDMFGKALNGNNHWETQPLSEVCEIGSGITKGRKLDGEATIEVPYLRVANVQDGFLNLNEIKSIEIRPGEQSRYEVREGDLLMTEGGDPDKLGRAAIWRGEVKPCVHQNHLFRVRPHANTLTPEFLTTLVGSTYGKNYFLRIAKRTTGIATINKTQLGKFPVIVPPLKLQQKFTELFFEVYGTAKLLDKASDCSETVSAGLLQKVFQTKDAKQ